MKQRGMLVAGLLVVIAMLTGCVPAAAPEEPEVAPEEAEVQPQEVTWNCATSKEGSAGYVGNLAVSRIVTEHVPGLTYVSVPTAGSVASCQLFGKGSGEVQACYPSSVDIYRMYRKLDPYQEIKWLPYQSTWIGTADLFVITKKDRTDINSLHDLAGKKFFAMGRGTSIHALWKMTLTHLGIWDDITIRDMGAMDAADALDLGTIDAVGAYTSSRKILSSWLKNIDARQDIRVVVPTEEERAAISELPFACGWDETGSQAAAFSQPVDKIWSFSCAFGEQFSPDCDPELVYLMMKALDENTGELVKMAPVLIMWLDMGVGPACAMGISANPDIPVHPGVAKWLKEKGLWNEDWVVGEYIELSPEGMDKLWELYGKAQ